jgi:hypothetical protein
MKNYNSSIERMEQFKYFETTITNQNSFQEIDVREYLLSFGGEYFVLQFSIKKFKLKINRAIFWPGVF